MGIGDRQLLLLLLLLLLRPGGSRMWFRKPSWDCCSEDAEIEVRAPASHLVSNHALSPSHAQLRGLLSLPGGQPAAVRDLASCTTCLNQYSGCLEHSFILFQAAESSR
ncbi:hypothetical protein BO94DRAFT_549488 [Aspergillus sclerotioniger CBS 115572]|uniref:Uncharacterized protein n=1 Tax=Aspergillus sclerotioniger CBS 115572 TaxID=1450535 RepID=A0A317VPM5_9EURO|nr:hypothetical protein BO94DRAFT_549488 [Aspergillus sclerotioniger CBS 115572]PWY75221.1 hypothetical protein BO94DRAFT_549488 [Aspergillus sclerotioniger CBS 115572]